eukprot:TRINITY_DN19880_c0_g2_i1.p1 TRINITY_DN19880_c0_g2~~TRINITY_DN19880_c0_g2_i1.p1  ORF type:complete len:412 (+),score=38.58 TRINITY_DN19880_c0_g2_i1:148-1236(+)
MVCSEDQDTLTKLLVTSSADRGVRSIYSSMKDSRGLTVKVRLFHAPYLNLADQMEHLLGLCEVHTGDDIHPSNSGNETLMLGSLSTATASRFDRYRNPVQPTTPLQGQVAVQWQREVNGRQQHPALSSVALPRHLTEGYGVGSNQASSFGSGNLWPIPVASTGSSRAANNSTGSSGRIDSGSISLEDMSCSEYTETSRSGTSTSSSQTPRPEQALTLTLGLPNFTILEFEGSFDGSRRPLSLIGENVLDCLPEEIVEPFRIAAREWVDKVNAQAQESPGSFDSTTQVHGLQYIKAPFSNPERWYECSCALKFGGEKCVGMSLTRLRRSHRPAGQPQANSIGRSWTSSTLRSSTSIQDHLCSL